mgnify:CR=1 FL=1
MDTEEVESSSDEEDPINKFAELMGMVKRNSQRKSKTEVVVQTARRKTVAMQQSEFKHPIPGTKTGPNCHTTCARGGVPRKGKNGKSLIPRHLNVQMWKYLLESYASEQAARMVAMENATSNSEDMIKNLTLEFNKARQAAITTEMLEIVSGAEALK